MALLITEKKIWRAAVHYSLPRGWAVIVLFITHYPIRDFKTVHYSLPNPKKSSAGWESNLRWVEVLPVPPRPTSQVVNGKHIISFIYITSFTIFAPPTASQPFSCRTRHSMPPRRSAGGRASGGGRASDGTLIFVVKIISTT